MSHIKELQSKTDKAMVNKVLDVQASIGSKIDELLKIKDIVSRWDQVCVFGIFNCNVVI